MNWKEYQENCKKTLCYTSYKEMIACSALEILDEVTEFLEHYYGENDERLLHLELGDILYPVAILTDYYNVVPEAIAEPFQVIKYSIGGDFIENTVYCAGKIAGIIKKVIRDGNYILDETNGRKSKFQYYLDSLFTLILDYCSYSKLNFSDILNMNIEKLFDRKERGVLQGDGDER